MVQCRKEVSVSQTAGSFGVLVPGYGWGGHEDFGSVVVEPRKALWVCKNTKRYDFT